MPPVLINLMLGMHSSQRAPSSASLALSPVSSSLSSPLTQDSLAGIHGIARRALGDALVVVNDVLVAARLPRVPAFVVKVLAEAEVHAAPVLEVIVRWWAGLHTLTIQVEVATGHTLGGVIRFRTVA